MTTGGTAAKVNRVGLQKSDYSGSISTMCKGCGHDRISDAIIEAAFRLGLKPQEVVKMSGIGCSSKTPAYFLGGSYGFNGTHGRMPSFTTGVHLAHRQLIPLGVSGDGDTASIGIGQFVHMIRRNPKAVYIIEDNGVYGLTKGQFSATADRNSPSKRGALPTEGPIDLCALALELGCGFVARSFSGDKKQLIPIIEAALGHRGLAVLDVISPCVTFNNHDASTKSYTYHRAHAVHYQDPSFVPFFEHIDIDYEPGTTQEVKLHDGSTLLLTKVDHDFDVRDRDVALHALRDTRSRGEILTGLLHVNEEIPELLENFEVVDEPLSSLGESELRPSREVLEKLNHRYRL